MSITTADIVGITDDALALGVAPPVTMTFTATEFGITEPKAVIHHRRMADYVRATYAALTD